MKNENNYNSVKIIFLTKSLLTLIIYWYIYIIYKHICNYNLFNVGRGKTNSLSLLSTSSPPRSGTKKSDQSS